MVAMAIAACIQQHRLSLCEVFNSHQEISAVRREVTDWVRRGKHTTPSVLLFVRPLSPRAEWVQQLDTAHCVRGSLMRLLHHSDNYAANQLAGAIRQLQGLSALRAENDGLILRGPFTEMRQVKSKRYYANHFDNGELGCPDTCGCPKSSFALYFGMARKRKKKSHNNVPLRLVAWTLALALALVSCYFPHKPLGLFLELTAAVIFAVGTVWPHLFRRLVPISPLRRLAKRAWF
jgi:hypothetical protein